MYVCLYVDRVQTVVTLGQAKVSRASMYTNVNIAVFPEPLGPTSRNNGRELDEVVRYMTRCRNNGIEITRSAAIAIAVGLGPINAEIQLCKLVEDIL